MATTDAQPSSSSTPIGNFGPFELRIHFRPDPNTVYPPNTPVVDRLAWAVQVEVYCQDVVQMMQQGLVVSPSNVVADAQFFFDREWDYEAERKQDDFSVHRTWTIREFPERQESECQWAGKITLSGHSIVALADFNLNNLTQRNVLWCTAKNRDNINIFSYCRPNDHPENYNRFFHTLHPKYGVWWFWPMSDDGAPTQGDNAMQIVGVNEAQMHGDNDTPMLEGGGEGQTDSQAMPPPPQPQSMGTATARAEPSEAAKRKRRHSSLSDIVPRTKGRHE